MKKAILIISVVVMILSLVGCTYNWGGTPDFENFSQVAGDYEMIAQLALKTYSEALPETKYITIDIYGGKFERKDTVLPLTKEQQEAVLIVGQKFAYLRVSKDAVYFMVDETGRYGLVYSHDPVTALYDAEIPQHGNHFRRINRNWYEWSD